LRSRSSPFIFYAPPPTQIYTLSLHDALPIYPHGARGARARPRLHARLHDRVGSRHRGGRAHREPVRPRRPRREPADRTRSVPRCALRGRCSAAGRASRPRSGARLTETRYLILAEGFSADRHYGKTMYGVLRYRHDDVVAILDSTRGPGDLEDGVPVVQTVNDALGFNPNTALVGVATQGGRFPPAWIDLLKSCIAAGLHVENGLHVFLSDDPELRDLAARHDVELRDLRRAPTDLSTATGANLSVPG